jgi:hypothetical protein
MSAIPATWLRTGHSPIGQSPPTFPFQSRISSGLSLPMNHPAAFHRSQPGPPPRRHQGACTLRHNDPIVTQHTRNRRVIVTHLRPNSGFPVTPPPYFSTFCVATPRQRCELRGQRPAMTRNQRPAPRSPTNFRVTSRPFSHKGARSEPFGVHRPRQLVKGSALLNLQPRRGKVLCRTGSSPDSGLPVP